MTGGHYGIQNVWAEEFRRRKALQEALRRARKRQPWHEKEKEGDRDAR